MHILIPENLNYVRSWKTVIFFSLSLTFSSFQHETLVTSTWGGGGGVRVANQQSLLPNQGSFWWWKENSPTLPLRKNCVVLWGLQKMVFEIVFQCIYLIQIDSFSMLTTNFSGWDDRRRGEENSVRGFGFVAHIWKEQMNEIIWAVQVEQRWKEDDASYGGNWSRWLVEGVPCKCMASTRQRERRRYSWNQNARRRLR